MKKIEDAPKELQKMFAVLWEESNILCEFKADAAHLFLKGFDAAMATGGLPQRTKRTISNLIKLEGQIYAISNDGKLFINHYTKPEEWRAYPDLPQD